MVVLSVYALVFCVFCLGLSIGVVLAVGMLLYFQVRYFTSHMQCFGKCVFLTDIAINRISKFFLYINKSLLILPKWLIVLTMSM
jgi:hypothetical protein